MRTIFLSVSGLFIFTLSGFSQNQEPALSIHKDATVNIHKNNALVFNPDTFWLKKGDAIAQGMQNGPVPVPTLKEKGNSKTPVVSGLAFSEYKPVVIPNKYENTELIKEPVKVTIQPNKFH